MMLIVSKVVREQREQSGERERESGANVSTLPLEENEDEEPKVDGDGAGSTEAKLAAEAQSTDHDEPDVRADDLPSSLREALSAPQEEDEHFEVIKENIVRFLLCGKSDLLCITTITPTELGLENGRS